MKWPHSCQNAGKRHDGAWLPGAFVCAYAYSCPGEEARYDPAVSELHSLKASACGSLRRSPGCFVGRCSSLSLSLSLFFLKRRVVVEITRLQPFFSKRA